MYTIRAADGGGVVRVLRCSQDCRVFDFSPDGSHIFFFRAVEGFPSIGDQLEGSLFVMAAEGTDLHRITPADTPVEVTGNSGGRLSPDGRRIVFASSGAIWTVRPDRTALRKVFEDAQGRLAITPTWSPDGRFILFGLDPPDSIATIDSAPANGLYVVEANGAHLTPVVLRTGNATPIGLPHAETSNAQTHPRDRRQDGPPNPRSADNVPKPYTMHDVSRARVDQPDITG